MVSVAIFNSVHFLLYISVQILVLNLHLRITYYYGINNSILDIENRYLIWNINTEHTACIVDPTINNGVVFNCPQYLQRFYHYYLAFFAFSSALYFVTTVLVGLNIKLAELHVHEYYKMISRGYFSYIPNITQHVLFRK